MTAPMILLAFGSLGAGAALAVGGTLANWLQPVTNPADSPEPHLAGPGWVFTVMILTVVALGVAIGYHRYGRRPVKTIASEWVSTAAVAARRDLFGDSLNEAAFMRPGRRLSRILVNVERHRIDGAVEGVARLIAAGSTHARRLQTGFARSYALTIFLGAIGLLAGFFVAGLS